MTKKVKFAFINDDAARKSAFRKRKRGLLKKTEELSTLCGIEACTVVFGPYEPRPSVWASAPGAEYVLGKFMTLPEMEKTKKMMSLQEFIRQRLKKAQEHLDRQLKENRERVITQIMNQCLVGRPVSGCNLDDLNDLAWLLNKRNEEMLKRLETMGQPPPLPPPLPLPVPLPPPPPNVVITTSATLPSSHPLPLPHHPQMGMENLAAAAAAVAGPGPGWTSMNSMNINNQHISSGGASDDMMLPYVHPNNPGNNSGMGPGPSFR